LINHIDTKSMATCKTWLASADTATLTPTLQNWSNS
jgi:hypothetical protein